MMITIKVSYETVVSILLFQTFFVLVTSSTACPMLPSLPALKHPFSNASYLPHAHLCYIIPFCLRPFYSSPPTENC